MKLFGFTPSFMAAIFMMMLASASLLAIDAQPKVGSLFDGSGIKATNDAAFTSQASIMSDSTMVGAYSASPFVKATSLFTSATVLRAVPVSDVIYSKAGTIISTPPILGIMSDSTTAKMFGSGSSLTASSEFGSGASRTSTTAQDGLFFKTDTLSSATTTALSEGQAYLSSAEYTGASLTTFGSGTALYTTTSHEILGIMSKAEAVSYSGYIMTGSVLILISALAIIGRKEKETADIIVGKEDNHHTMNTEDANDIDNSHTSAFNSFMVKFLSKEHGAKAYSKYHFGKFMSSIISLFHKLGFTNMTHYGGSPALSSSKA